MKNIIFFLAIILPALANAQSFERSNSAALESQCRTLGKAGSSEYRRCLAENFDKIYVGPSSFDSGSRASGGDTYTDALMNNPAALAAQSRIAAYGGQSQPMDIGQAALISGAYNAQRMGDYATADQYTRQYNALRAQQQNQRILEELQALRAQQNRPHRPVNCQTRYNSISRGYDAYCW